MSSSSSSPFPDLNIIPYPLLHPKPEPVESPTATASAAEGADDAALLEEYLRLAHLYDRSLIPQNSQNPHNSLPLAVAPPKKIKARGRDIVRATALDPRDALYYRDLVRRRRITYESLRALLIREESLKGPAFESIWGKRGRSDLKAATLMGRRDLWLHRDKRIIGNIPGISVGDVFFFRVELCLLGLHGVPQAGIDYVPACRSTSGEPIATSIIVSGGYEDDDDKGLVLVYTGQGGREHNVQKQSMNQKLEGGNLALERSMNYGIEIRVIRGVKFDRSPIGKLYVYDGLYKIVSCWLDVGKAGFGVYKYKLLRIEDQDEMGSELIRLAEAVKVDPLRARPANCYLSLDISNGRENLQIAVFNDIDEDNEPLLYDYLARPIYPPETSQGKAMADMSKGCDCVNSCSVGCDCALRNGGEFAYDGSEVLVRGKPLVYECGPACRCPPCCPNRVSQKGLRHRLEIFRSRETGWGVRSLDLIRAGAFICELSGMVLSKEQVENQSMHGDSLVHPAQFPARWTEWGDLSDVITDYQPADFPSVPDLNFSVDVTKARNVACYLSHSCSPNVFVQFVLYDHYNVLYPHVMIFAMENIPPLRELSIDYGIREEWVPPQITM